MNLSNYRTLYAYLRQDYVDLTGLTDFNDVVRGQMELCALPMVPMHPFDAVWIAENWVSQAQYVLDVTRANIRGTDDEEYCRVAPDPRW